MGVLFKKNKCFPATRSPTCCSLARCLAATAISTVLLIALDLNINPTAQTAGLYACPNVRHNPVNPPPPLPSLEATLLLDGPSPARRPVVVAATFSFMHVVAAANQAPA